MSNPDNEPGGREADAWTIPPIIRTGYHLADIWSMVEHGKDPSFGGLGSAGASQPISNADPRVYGAYGTADPVGFGGNDPRMLPGATDQRIDFLGGITVGQALMIGGGGALLGLLGVLALRGA